MCVCVRNEYMKNTVSLKQILCWSRFTTVNTDVDRQDEHQRKPATESVHKCDREGKRLSIFSCETQKEDGRTHIYDHFTALAGSDLAKQLQDESLGHVSGQIPHIPKHKHKQTQRENRQRSLLIQLLKKNTHSYKQELSLSLSHVG